jgi:hypothetical protein
MSKWNTVLFIAPNMSKQETKVGPEKSTAPKKEITKAHATASSSTPDKPLDWKDRESKTSPVNWRVIPDGKGPVGVLWPPKYQLRNNLDDHDYCRKMLEKFGSIGAPPEFKRGQKLYHGGSTDALEHPEKGHWFYLTLDKHASEYYAGKTGYSDPSDTERFVSAVGTAPGVTCYRYLGEYDADFLVCRWDELAGLYGYDVDLSKYKKWSEVEDSQWLDMIDVMKAAEFASEKIIEAVGYDGRVSEQDDEIGLPPSKFYWLEKIDCDTAPDFYDSDAEQESQSGGDDDDDDGGGGDDDDNDDDQSIAARIGEDLRASQWLVHTKVHR